MSRPRRVPGTTSAVWARLEFATGADPERALIRALGELPVRGGEVWLLTRLGASATVVYRIAHRAAELADALRERIVCVARPVLKEFDQGQHLARVEDLDRSARANSVHLRGDRLRRGRLPCARLEFLADAPRHFDLSAADVEVDAVEALRHREEANA